MDHLAPILTLARLPLRANLAAVKMSIGLYHHGNLRQAILDEASRVLENEAPRRSGPGPGSVPRCVACPPGHHFTDRTELLRMASQGYERLGDALEAGMIGADPERRLVAAGEGTSVSPWQTRRCTG